MMGFLLITLAVAFDASWCEPQPPPHKPLHDADLVMVQVITRHGARTPLHIAPSVEHVWRCNHTEFRDYGSGVSRPVRVHVTHGDSLLLGDCHFGQLLDRGAQALRRLGNHFRDIYIHSLKLLPAEIVASLVKFSSTGTHRTQHSAMSFIAGLYPEFEDVTLHISDKAVDPWRRSSSLCPALKRNMEALRKSSEYEQMFGSRRRIFDTVAAAVGGTAKTAQDIVMATRCDGRSVNATEQLLDTAALLKAEQQKFLFAHKSVYPLMFSFSATDMVNAMIARVNGESTVRFVLWSAHDGNMFGILGYLGTGSDLLPPYGSFVTTELWKRRSDGEFRVRFLFNGEVIHSPRFNNQTDVGLRDFIDFVEKNMPDLTRDCGLDAEKLGSSRVFKPEEN